MKKILTFLLLTSMLTACSSTVSKDSVVEFDSTAVVTDTVKVDSTTQVELKADSLVK